jgi:hypothetical protein
MYFPRSALALMIAVLSLGAFAGRADAANAALTVTCTFTINKDVSIAWSGALTGVTAINWPLGTVALGGSYSTVDGDGTGSGWPYLTSNPLTITNGSLTGNGVNIALNSSATSATILGVWSEQTTTGANQYQAYATTGAVPTAAALEGAGNVLPTIGLPTFITLAPTATSSSIWLALTMPTTITAGAGAQQTISFVFTGSAQ